ncbi:BTB/POZ domain-containing protein 3-like [Contarinia nasturtii]|uniref:BTB/POZ domain-containing protein 3-like n=1 Tax=Contarinia nasturtii TaxID=265458 RepID=UPI0012D44282|nr:BTB/POZ domain-containing protein 3-like [Contarinia nasturtii]
MSTKTLEYAIKGILLTGQDLYLSEIMADFHFICKSSDESDERIPVHKLLLAGISDVFRAMFHGWKEKVDVVLPDATAAEFKEFLQFFYLGRAKLTMDNIAKVMYLGDKYNVTECINACVKFLRQTLTDDNYCCGFWLAILYNQSDLKRFCELMIAINTKAVFSSASFLQCDKDVLGHILRMDTLTCSESKVFRACMEWVKSTSGATELTRSIVQKCLGHLFYEFSFKSMTPQQFARLVPSYGRIFSVEEYSDITQSTAIQHFKPNIFKQTPRTTNLYFDDMEKIECDRLVALDFSRSPYCIKSIETTVFSVNEPLLLRQIEFSQVGEFKSNEYCAIVKLSTEIKIVQLTKSASSNVELSLYEGNTYLKSELTYMTLSKPILIRPGVMYEIQMKQTPIQNFCTGNILKTEVQMESNIIVQFHRDPIVGNDIVARGMIRKLEFYRF